MSHAVCQTCGKRGTVNNQLPDCDREDCPSRGFQRAINEMGLFPILTPSSNKPEAEMPYKGSPLEKINNLEAALEAERARRIKAEEVVDILAEALSWASGSDDFNEGGQAREGWLKLGRQAIEKWLQYCDQYPRVEQAPAKEYDPGPGCHAGQDGECGWSQCPQLRDGEPVKSGRHCPLDTKDYDEG